MSKTKFEKRKLTTQEIKNKFLFHYTEKFYNKWMSKYQVPELNYQQQEYIFKRFWSIGSIACIDVTINKSIQTLLEAGLISKEDLGSNELVFVDWTPGARFNTYDYPTHARAINKRGFKFIPNDELELDKEIVIIYAQKNHKSVFSSIECKLNELVDIEMKIRSARKAQSQGWMFTGSSEDEAKIKTLQDAMDDDEPYLFTTLEEVDKFKGVASGAPYITDKLEQERQKVENDILTILGYNNVGVSEKKEHLTVNEVDANNEDIEASSESYTNLIQDGFNRIAKAFDKTLTLIDLNAKISDNKDDEDNEDIEDKEDDENVQ